MRRVDPILVFDLDGTVLRINSFPVWLLFLAFGGALSRRQLIVSLRAARLLMRRKLGGMTHAAFLRETQALWEFATASDGGVATRRLTTLLLRTVRRNIVPALKLVSDGVLDGLIATAAAENYAVALGERLGLPTVLATRNGRDADEPDNSGQNKRDRLMAWLDAQACTERPLIFFNDDMSDLPLMRDASVVCWFGSGRSLNEARRLLPSVRFVDCRQLNAREMQATMAHICHSVTIGQLQRASTFA